ncbi:hypothetical protein GGI35DRAFT_465839 [Trichoderma velutinum]
MASLAHRIKSGAHEMTFKGGPTLTRKRNYDTSERNDDGNSNDDPYSKGPPTAKIRLQICHFCAHVPQGKAMSQARGCDYTRLPNGDIIECQNCADFRSEHPGSEHKCEPLEPLRKGKIWRRYGIHHPLTYTTQACDQCLASGKPNQCNVDYTLNYGCTATKVCKAGNCTINGHKLEIPPKSLSLAVAPWTRTECQCCEQMTKKGIVTIGCSWLGNRTARDHPCWNCRARNLACLDGGRLIAEPANLTLPRTWNVALTHDFGFVDCKRNGTDRRMCKRCLEDKRCHCLADAGSYRYACNRCAQLGIDCIDSGNDTYYPIFDLARVGIGLHLPFIQCSCCIRTGRNCDLQRPCDSCVEHGEQCDAWEGDTAKCCINGRLEPRPGPLYYLALGYGAQGVNDIKDGSAVEHWVGPLTSIYGMIPERQDRQLIASFAADLRGQLFAYGQPPHGVATQNGVMFGPASMVTKENIVAWIESQFPDLHPINEYEGYANYIQAAGHFVQNLRSGMPRRRLLGQFLSNEPRSFTHGPDCGESCCVDVAGNVSAHGLAVAATISPVSAPAPAPFLNHDTLALIPMPMDIDGNDSGDARGYIYENENENENVVCQGAGTLQDGNFQWPNPHFDFNAAAPSDQETAVVRFSPDFSVEMDLSIGPNPYPSPSTAAARFNPSQIAFSDFNADFDTFLDFNSNHAPVGEPGMHINIDSSLLTRLEINPPEVLVDEQDRDANIDPRLRTAFVDFNPLQFPANNLGTDLNIAPNEDINIPQLEEVAPNDTSASFGIAPGKTNGDGNGFNNILSDIPRRARPVKGSSAGTCLEIRDAQVCENRVVAGSVCQSISHGNDPVHACDHCSKASAIELVSVGSCFNMAAVENMRAYLCNHCAEKVSKDVRPVLRNRLTNNLTVWGRCSLCSIASRIPIPYNRDGGTITFMGDAQKITGCLCGTKLLARRLCYSHRLKYRNEVVSQAQKMQDWCQRKYGAKICFVCLKGSQPRVVAFDGRQWVSNVAKCTAWQCLVCGDLVVNQPTMGSWGRQGPRAIVSSTQASADDAHENQDGEPQESEHGVQEISSEELRGEEVLRSYADGNPVSFGESSTTYWDEGSNGNQEGALYESTYEQGTGLFGEQAEAKHQGQDGGQDAREDGEQAQEQAQRRDTSESSEEAVLEEAWTIIQHPV